MLFEMIAITPEFCSSSAIISSGANQTSASHALCSESRSCHVCTRQIRIADTPASATNAFGIPCHGEVTQPAITPSRITTSQHSSRPIRPIRRSSSRAIVARRFGVA